MYSQEVERKINISSEDLDPQSVFEEWVNRFEQVDDLLTKQRNLLKRVPQSQHLATCEKSLATEFGGPMQQWSESFRDLQKFTQYIQVAELSKIREIVELDEELKYYRSEFNKKIQEYENTASDVSKSEWLLEKLTDIEKLIVNIKAVGDKRRQLLNTEEARNIAAEQQKTATKDLKQRVSTVRKLIEEQQKREEEMSKQIGTSKLPITAESSVHLHLVAVAQLLLAKQSD